MNSSFAMIAQVLIVIVALLHLAFLVLEMFYWDHPVGRKIFGMSPEKSAASKVLAANQGLYNGFLAAGLLVGLWAGNWFMVKFFLGCVLVAAIYGAISVKRSILFTQGLPAFLALLALWMSQRGA